MADSTETTVIPTTNESNQTETSSSTSAPTELKPPEIKRSWGDEVDDELPVDQLSINERKELDDPDDTSIQAVLILITIISETKYLNLDFLYLIEIRVLDWILL